MYGYDLLLINVNWRCLDLQVITWIILVVLFILRIIILLERYFGLDQNIDMLSQNQAFLFAHWSWHDNSCSILASRILLHICLGYGTTVQGNLHGRGRRSAKYLGKFAFPTWIERRLLQTGLEDLNLRFFERFDWHGIGSASPWLWNHMDLLLVQILLTCH